MNTVPGTHKAVLEVAVIQGGLWMRSEGWCCKTLVWDKNSFYHCITIRKVCTSFIF